MNLYLLGSLIIIIVSTMLFSILLNIAFQLLNLFRYLFSNRFLKNQYKPYLKYVKEVTNKKNQFIFHTLGLVLLALSFFSSYYVPIFPLTAFFLFLLIEYMLNFYLDSLTDGQLEELITIPLFKLPFYIIPLCLERPLPQKEDLTVSYSQLLLRSWFVIHVLGVVIVFISELNRYLSYFKLI